MEKCLTYSSQLGDKDSTCTNKKNCSFKMKYGGVLAFIHPDFFQTEEESDFYGIQKIEAVMNLLRFLKKTNLYILDYGIADFISGRFPFSQTYGNSALKSFNNLFYGGQIKYIKFPEIKE